MTHHTREDEIRLFKKIEETSRRLDNEIKFENNRKFNDLMKKTKEIIYNKIYLEKKIRRSYNIYSWQLAHGYVWGYLNALFEVKKITQETMWKLDLYSFKLCKKFRKKECE